MATQAELIVERGTSITTKTPIITKMEEVGCAELVEDSMTANENVLEFSVPSLPPSVNGYWKVKRFGGRYISAEGVAFKKLVYKTLGKLDYKERGPLRLELELYSPNWITKKGTISMTAGDADNFCKSSIDSLFNCLPFMNDSQIFELSVVKKIGPTSTLFYLRSL